MATRGKDRGCSRVIKIVSGSFEALVDCCNHHGRSACLYVYRENVKLLCHASEVRDVAVLEAGVCMDFSRPPVASEF